MPQPCHPDRERTRISYYAALNRTTHAPFREERRTHSINANNLHRKSGGAKWRDLQFSALAPLYIRQAPLLAEDQQAEKEEPEDPHGVPIPGGAVHHHLPELNAAQEDQRRDGCG